MFAIRTCRNSVARKTSSHVVSLATIAPAPQAHGASVQISTCDNMKHTSVSILTKLVSFDTTSRNSNLALIEWAAEHLRPLGTRVELVYDAIRMLCRWTDKNGPVIPSR
jgi:hypothetical protein